MQEYCKDLDFIKSRLKYNPDTGLLTWLRNDNYPEWWNSRYVGTSPKSKDKLGYLRAKITRVVNGVKYSNYVSCHRLAFYIYHGWLPDVVDHIDGDVTNNKISNLRAADEKTNTWNRVANKDTLTGYKGVSVVRQRDGVGVCGYKAMLGHNGKREYIGFFRTAEQARNAVIAREEQLRSEWLRK